MDEKGKMNTEKYEELIKEVEANSPYKRLSSAKKKWMSVSEMGELLGLKKGKIAVGFDADLLFLDEKLNLKKVIIGGKIFK